MNISKEINDLRSQIKEHDRKYYIDNNPEIPDSDYDILVKELKRLEELNPDLKTNDSPTVTVNGTTDSRFKLIKHIASMLSLTNNQDVDKFTKTVAEYFTGSDGVIEYSVEPKIDGLAINLIYIDGVLTHAVTRGDGEIGEDVTHTVNYISDIPKTLMLPHKPYLLEVRGEVYMKKTVLTNINEQLINQSKPILANPRNAAAGTVRMLDGEESGKRQLNFFAYGMGSFINKETPVTMHTHSERLSYLKTAGFPINSLNTILTSSNDIYDYIKDIMELRPQLNYDIDGVVIKVNDLKAQIELGNTSKAPKWAIAFKLPPEEVTTTILNVEWQVGKTGALTPVAILSPVQINGVVVSRCTLHNYAYVLMKGVMINDTVIIRRAGDVVPELVSVIFDRRSDNVIPVTLPSECPSCQSVLSLSDEKNSIRCNNGINCPSQLTERLAHFVSRDVFNITGLGIKQIEDLVNKERLKRFEDIFLLTSSDVSEKVLTEINKSKKITLDRLFYSLGIFGVGRTLSKVLIKHFGSIHDFMKADYDFLMHIPDIGKLTAERIIKYFSNPVNIEAINSLINSGVYVEPVGILKNHTLKGINIVITGILPIVGRKKLAEMLENNGVIVGNTVTKNTGYLIVGDSPGSKLNKAKELNIPVLTENQILDMI